MDRRRIAALALLTAAIPAAARAAPDKGEKKRTGGATYLPISTLLGTTLQGKGRRGVMSVDCGLNIPDGALRARAEASIPRLRAAYVQTIQAYAAGLSAGELPDADYIGQTLQRQTDAVLGRPGARLLLGAILVN